LPQINNSEAPDLGFWNTIETLSPSLNEDAGFERAMEKDGGALRGAAAQEVEFRPRTIWMQINTALSGGRFQHMTREHSE